MPLEDEDEYDTVGGLVYHRIGGVPTAGRRDPGGRPRASPSRSTDGRRVGKVLVVRERQVTDESAADEDE